MSDQRTRKPGFALLQVMIIVGVAAVLGFAVLAESSLKAQSGNNSVLAAQADSLAESGANLAMYYLLNPWNAPTLQNGYWPGGTNISLGGSVPGTVDVTVAKDLTKTEEYVIRSTGKRSGSAVAHAVNARVRLEPGLKVKRATSARKGLSVASNVLVNGDVAANDKFTNYGVVNGTAYASSFDNRNVITTMRPISTTDPAGAPAPGVIQTYPTYVHSDGKVYSRTNIPVPSIGGGVMDNLGPTLSNPAGVYYYNGNLTVNNNLKVAGTLIVNGNLILNGSGINIIAGDGFPALIVIGEFRTKAWKSITVDGMTYIGKVMKPDGLPSTGANLTFNGSLLFGDDGAIQMNSGSWVRVNYVDSRKLILPDLDTSKVRSVTVLSWKQ